MKLTPVSSFRKVTAPVEWRKEGKHVPEGVSCSQDRNIPDPENTVEENLRVPTLMWGERKGGTSRPA